jgi:class 3 adenylate cyclase
VNLGDVMVEGDQIYGDGINFAARLESLADPGLLNGDDWKQLMVMHVAAENE